MNKRLFIFLPLIVGLILGAPESAQAQTPEPYPGPIATETGNPYPGPVSTPTATQTAIPLPTAQDYETPGIPNQTGVVSFSASNNTGFFDNDFNVYAGTIILFLLFVAITCGVSRHCANDEKKREEVRNESKK